MPSPDTINFNELDFNEEFTLAFETIEHEGGNVFVTGKAGTGKSTLLQYFRYKTTKKNAILAPTGVAALNIKGQTIHSFFQFKPDITPDTVGEIILRRAKRKMYASLQVLVIDEVSMVRADLMDCVDSFLRLHGPNPTKPFGGVQVVLFGDLYQLPPVVKMDEENIFRSIYQSPFFFSAKCFKGFSLQVIELKKIYRQKDEAFIHLLNAVRGNALSVEHLRALNTRVSPRHVTPEGEFYITLTTTNMMAEKVNIQQLSGIASRPIRYAGTIAGEFDRRSLPTSEVLEIKPGAQIMMLNNDTDKRWFNGSLGCVLAIKEGTGGDDIIIVQLASGNTVNVKKYTWEIYQYYFDEATEALNAKVIGYFTQYPLKLAWAVTIHKSQGQTFERVIIDLGQRTFAHGQMYVALSRCTTLQGIILKQPIARHHVMIDSRVMQFMKN